MATSGNTQDAPVPHHLGSFGLHLPRFPAISRLHMMSDSESGPASGPAHGSGAAHPKRSSRGGRGRGRGRGGRRPSTGQSLPPSAAIPAETAEPIDEPGGDTPLPPEEVAAHAQSEAEAARETGEMHAPVGPEEEESFFAPSPEVEVPDQPAEPAHAHAHAPPTPSHKFQPATSEAVKKAIDDVMGILSSLRESSEKMDEVLEILEEAERQKTADEREIESLRQQLRRFHRAPEEIPRPARPPSGGGAQQQQHGHGGQRPRDGRDSRDNRGQHRGHRDPRERDRRDRDPRGYRGSHEGQRAPSGHAPAASGSHPEHEQRPEPSPASARAPDAPTEASPPREHGSEHGDPS